MQQSRITILGAGSWGTALANLLVENGHQVMLWTYRKEQVNEIQTTHRNAHYLPNLLLNEKLQVTSDLEKATAFGETVGFVVPTNAMREVLKKCCPYFLKKNQAGEQPVLFHAAKGIELGTHQRISQIFKEELLSVNYRGPVVFSGPSHAEEVAKKDLTAITAASSDLEAAAHIQSLFMNTYLRVYTNADVIGVELGGALKNIIALCSGALMGLGFGDNAKAALMTRGLAEMTRLGVSMGADPLTFSGLSGLGDLIVTCTSQYSRNWQAGYQLGQGKTTQEILDHMGMVVEGIHTTKSAYELAKSQGIEMPITEATYQVVYQGRNLRETILELMGRSGKNESTFQDQKK